MKRGLAATTISFDKKSIGPTDNSGREAKVADKIAANARAWREKPEILKNHHRIVLGDSRQLERYLTENSVHLVVTSPPYWNLKRYRADLRGAQLGHIEDRAVFLEGVQQVWRRLLDVLVPGGRLCIVVGDVCRSRKAHGRHVVEPLHAHVQVQVERIGFDPLAPIIWNKIANATTEVKGNGGKFLGKPYEPNAIIKNDIEFILLFRKPGGYRHPTQEQRDLSLISKEDHRLWFQQVWSDIKGDAQRNHPAPFPVEVARRLIGMFSFVGDVVLDPFLGSGTTTVAAMAMHRSSVGIEVDSHYLEVARNCVGVPLFDSTVEYDV